MTRNGPLRRFPIPILLMIVLGCELGVATAATRSGLTVVATAHSATSIERPVASSAMARATTTIADAVPTQGRALRRASVALVHAMQRAEAAAARHPWIPQPVARPEILATARASVVAPPPARQQAGSPPRATSGGSRTSPTSGARHVGRNHVWIPSLGISRSIAYFPCTRKEPPANLVYRWGCAGRNNVYLMGHAYGVFKALHDAYVRGRLHKGMTVDYADGTGHVRRYAVVWWKVTPPTTAASWAWAAQSRPSMTLQTCVGPTGQDRLMVRLVATH